MAKASASNATPAPPAPPPTPAECREILAGLRDQHAKLVARGAEIAGQREQLAGLALIDRDPEASSRLQELTVETTRIAVDQGNLEAAIKAAETRLKAAQAREAAAAEVEKARLAREIIGARQDAAKNAEEALSLFNESYSALITLGNQLRRLTDKATSMAHESMVLRSCQQMSRCELVKKGLISSEPMPDERLRAPLSELIAHLDLPTQRETDRIIDDGAPEAPSEATKERAA